MKNILVPVDFSAHSDKAVATAALIAEAHHAVLTILHVVSGPYDWITLPIEIKKQRSEINNGISVAWGKFNKLKGSKVLKNCKSRFDIVVGRVDREVVKYANNHASDLIVIGVHGAGDSKQFIGSSTQKIIRSSPCPVISVKKEYLPKVPGRIVLPVDLLNDYGAAIKRLSDLASPFKSVVDMVFINTPETFADTPTAEKRLSTQNRFRRLEVNEVIYNAKDKQQGILDFSGGTDMIALATTTRRERTPGYNIGTTEAIVFNSDIPVWTFVI